MVVLNCGCQQSGSTHDMTMKCMRQVTQPTPVFNTPDLREIFGGPDGNTLKTDKCGLVRELETVLLPGTPIKILEEIKVGDTTMLRIETPAYPYPTKKGYYVDSRFFVPALRVYPHKMPSRSDIIKNLVSMVGCRYIWGGNWPGGIPQMLEYYPPKDPVTGIKATRWMLKGVDCSGLLYNATHGATPRNTSALINFGEPVEIAGLSVDEIAQKLQPLDLIAWKGHVAIVIGKTQIIESAISPDSKTGKDGVRITDLKKRLSVIMKNRKPENDYSLHPEIKRFVVRKWYRPDFTSSWVELNHHSE